MADTKVKKTTKVAKPAVKKAVVKKVTAPKETVAGKNAKPAAVVKEAKITAGTLKIDVIGANGVKKGSVSLPTDIFGVKPNATLIAQAVRVYLANQRQGSASTKTRGQVKGSTRKIYRQKGTGRARHGAITAPIFVGGGIAFGPQPRDFSLKMPKKMKKIAFASALSLKAHDGVIKVVDGEFGGTTKEFSKLLKSMSLTDKRGKAVKVLLVVGSKDKGLAQGARNIGGLTVESASTLSTYPVSISRNIIFAKDAIDEVVNRFNKN